MRLTSLTEMRFIPARRYSLAGMLILNASNIGRLADQVKNYDLYYDYNIIAAGSRHGLHVAEHVPEWWGIITVEEVGGKLDFYFLRRPELARILELNNLPRYREKSKEFVQRKLLEKVPETILWQQVCEELFQRDYNTIDDEIRRFRNGRRAASLL